VTSRVDIQQQKCKNINFNYIINLIGCFSECARCISLNDKTVKKIIKAFADLFKTENLKNY